jgi:phosphoribosylformylglycinamidine synthase
MAAGLVRACHDPSEGGLAVAAAEMALGGQIGLDLDLAAVSRPPALQRYDAIAFSESMGRLLLEVAPGDAARFEETMGPAVLARIGRVRGDGRFVIRSGERKPMVDLTLSDLDRAWRGHLA